MTMQLRSSAPQRVYEPGEPLVETSHAAEADINFIVDQFTRTGVLLHNSQYEGRYGDFVNAQTFELAQEAIANANTMFESLPEAVRRDFKGGTAEFLEFMADESNRDQIEEYGLTTDHLPEVQPTNPETKPAQPEPLSASEQATLEDGLNAQE